jgi:anti-sigma B factor antagonist
MVQSLIADGHNRIALNVARLTFIDARGLGELVHTATTFHRGGGELLLVAPTAQLQKMLSVTRLASVIQVCESEAEAIRRLSGNMEADCASLLVGV